MGELKAAIRKMKNWRSGAEAQIPAEYFKALLKADCEDKDNSHTLEAVLAIFAEVWKSGSYPGDDNIPEEVVIRSTEEALGVRNKGPLFNSNEEEWRFEFQQVRTRQRLVTPGTKTTRVRPTTRNSSRRTARTRTLRGIWREDSYGSSIRVLLLTSLGKSTWLNVIPDETMAASVTRNG